MDLARYRAGGYEAIGSRSRAAHRVHKRVIILRAGLDVRVLTQDGELLRALTLDPTKDYQGTGRPPGPPKGRPLGPRKKKIVYDAPTQAFTMP
jgi:hypothetical protein